MLYDMNVGMFLVGNIELGASKMAQHVKALANKPDDLISSHKAHMIEEAWPPQTVLKVSMHTQ